MLRKLISKGLPLNTDNKTKDQYIKYLEDLVITLLDRIDDPKAYGMLYNDIKGIELKLCQDVIWNVPNDPKYDLLDRISDRVDQVSYIIAVRTGDEKAIKHFEGIYLYGGDES